MEVKSHLAKSGTSAHGGSQPIALAAGTLVVILLGVGAIALWRSVTGGLPEPDRIVAARLLQAKAVQASEQLVEKTKGLEVTQQESIDQLQVVQDQLQSVKRLLAEQQSETKRLTDQVSTLTEAMDNLRQSFASVQNTEASEHPAVRTRFLRTRHHATRAAAP